MLDKSVDGLRVEGGKKYIDATIGGGGHAAEIVKRGGILLGVDADTEAIEYTKRIVKATLVQGNFKDIETIAKEHGFGKVSGILFDLGVSSHQLDMPGRGFSYRFTDAPLDLRLNQAQGETAAQLVNRASSEQLYEIFTRFAEEELAWPITHRIVRARAIKPIETTGELVRVVGNSPARLSRVFQALRIAVNDELGALKEGLAGAENLLETMGRLVVLTFHSLEDRIVKQFMQKNSWRVITHKPEVPSWTEQKQNPRARSAKLRIAEKI